MDEVIEHPDGGDRFRDQEIVVVTGSSGLIGFPLIQRLAKKYRMIGLDRLGPPYPPPQSECVNFDITDEKAIDAAMERIRYGYGSKISAVIHLAAYYDFQSKDSPGYQKINEEGTRNFMKQLQDFEVEQFIYSSTDLIYKPTKPGQKIDENCPIDAKWGYPESKVHTEDIIRSMNKNMQTTFLRIGGVYTDWCESIPIAQQIKRIYEKQFISHFYAGDVDHGDVFVHHDDVLRSFELALDKRRDLPQEVAINIGEPETPTYQELQDRIGQLIHGKEWKTYEMPEQIAKAGAWMRDIVDDPFIKPWMIDRADDHYELDISRAKEMLDWEPKRSVMETLPEMIGKLKKDENAFYKKNELNK